MVFQVEVLDSDAPELLYVTEMRRRDNLLFIHPGSSTGMHGVGGSGLVAGAAAGAAASSPNHASMMMATPTTSTAATTASAFTPANGSGSGIGGGNNMLQSPLPSKGIGAIGTGAGVTTPLPIGVSSPMGSSNAAMTPSGATGSSNSSNTGAGASSSAFGYDATGVASAVPTPVSSPLPGGPFSIPAIPSSSSSSSSSLGGGSGASDDANGTDIPCVRNQFMWTGVTRKSYRVSSHAQVAVTFTAVVCEPGLYDLSAIKVTVLPSTTSSASPSLSSSSTSSALTAVWNAPLPIIVTEAGATSQTDA